MTDYLPLLSRAVANLDGTPEARRRVYDRARQALLGQLRAMNPPLSEAEITRERLALEEAIRRVDQQVNAKSNGPVPPSASPQPPAAPAPPEAQVAKPMRPNSPPPPLGGPAAAIAAGRAASAAATAERERPADSKAAVGRAAAASVAAPAAARAARDSANSGQADELQLDSAHETGDFHERPRGGNTANALTAPLQPRARDRAADFAKADAEKARRAKLIVGGIVGLLLAAAILIGYVHRDRILASFGLGDSPARVSTAERAAPSGNRIQAETKATSSAQPSGSNVPAAAVAQRAVLYEENPGAPAEQLQTFVGTAVWRTETVSPGPGRPPELALRVDVEIPDRKMTVTITMRRNPDTTLPASHTIEVQFQAPGDPFGGVANMPGIRAKTTETAQGAPLVGLVVRVMPGFFLIGLSAIDADKEQNLSLLRERGWLDLPFVYNNGRRAVLVIEKGAPGERAVNEAIAAWGG
jgi:hypothetical protein